MLDYQTTTDLGKQPELLIENSSKEPTIALLHCYDLIDDFLNSIHLSFETFCKEFVGSWMFGYINALKKVGVRTVLFCISDRVIKPERYQHIPTGATICVLPANGIYRTFRAIRNRALRAYDAQEGQTFKDVLDSKDTRYSLLTKLKDLVKSAGSYFSTPLGELARELRQEGCQAILCQEYEFARFDACVGLGKRIGIPVFATFQGGNQTQSFLEYPLRHLAFRFCQGAIIATETEIERVRENYKLPDAKIARIFNPIDITVWQRCDRSCARESIGVPLDARVVVWHGRVEIERKGLDILLDAWELVCCDRPNQDLRLLLIGTGSDATKLHYRLTAKPLPGVIWIDEFINDRTRVQQYLSAADVYVMSSRQEGFPVAPIEAMACSLPIVATDAPGIPDILEHGEADGGLIVPRNDASALAGAIGTVLDHLEEAQELGRRARLRVEQQFASEAVGQQLRDFLIPSPD